MVAAYYTERSKNQKTGDIPQQYIGADKAEVTSTCQGCPLLTQTAPDKTATRTKHQIFGLGCYAHFGSVARAQRAIWRFVERGGNRSLTNALTNARRGAKYVRMSVIGDPSGLDDIQLQADEAQIRDSGMGVLNYTHFWQGKGAHLQGRAMASCDTWEEANAAVNAGWRAAVHVPDLEVLQGKTDAGHTYTLCPNQRPKATQCNECGLCDAAKPATDIIVFLEH